MSSDTRRLLVAIAIAIAIHEMLAGLVPARMLPGAPAREVVTHVQIARVAMRPTPTPKPPPPPHAVSRSHTIAPVATLPGVHRTTGSAARKGIVRHAHAARPKTPAIAQARPVWDTPASPVAHDAGSGTNTGAGSLGSAAPGAGTGSTGDGGSGNGTAGGNEPCGFVDFSDPHGSRYDPRTHGFWVDIRMSVRLSDGSTQSIVLDYPWYYPNEASNPWSDQNLRDPDFPTRFQAPPPDKIAAESPLVQYVIEHSTPDGLTLLRDCPTASPMPTPRT